MKGETIACETVTPHERAPNRYVDPNRLPCSAIILVIGAYLLA